ncbi:tetrapeptide repeat homeobox protein 2-like [Lytechinus pictus]|uniref:tetrapeptide repeat homeobox protein 2-like n=1 Tax=Lytechinus pictus TaxID=7653 RepID=UPI0030B9C278
MDTVSSDASATEPETEGKFGMLKRKRRKRTIITPEQLIKLEELYKQEQWPGRDRKEELAREIEMSSHFVNIWFQNKRSRLKKLAQEEEEIKAMKSRAEESSKCVKKIPLAPKRELKKKDEDNNAAGTTRLPPVISAPIQSIMPPVGGLPVFTITTKNGPGPASPVFTSLPQLAVPLIPQNTLFATVPQSACLQNKEKVVTPSAVTLPALVRGTIPGTARSKSVRLAATQLMSPDPPKRSKSTSGATTFLVPSLGSSYSCNDNNMPNACHQPKEQSGTSNSTPVSSNTASKIVTPTSPLDPASTLLRCMILMMAMSEVPCSISKESWEFDLAVSAMLYGVKLNNGSVLTYDKRDGFHIDKVVKKRKKGKKKKKEKTGKKE